MKNSQAFEWPVIDMYTRQMAITDGVLVDLMQPGFIGLVRQAGIKFPVAMTAAAFQDYVELTPKAKEAGNDIKGRLWDVLWMLRTEILKSRGRNLSEILFQFYCVTDRIKPSLCTLKSVVGPGDDGEPVITIMKPEED
ncbi:MAG: DUF6573 family protein [Thermodesulfobacteriota bacterium]